MKTIRKIMALALVLCMAAAMGVWNTDAHADWYTVQFNKLDNITFENIPTGVTLTTTAAAPASAADTPAAATSGAAADPQKPGQLEWFYNPWAGTLVIRGRGAMVGFDEKHPAPWHNESKRALRVIIDEGVTTISNEAFKDFIYLRSVVFPSTLKGISPTAFEKCEKLKRVEVVTEIKDAEKLIEASKSEELLMDDVKIIRVTKEAVRREICWLTTYWWDRVEIYRDRAGRPIRIIEHKCDGSTVDTGIKYLNEATAVNEAKDPDTVERSYSVTTTRRGEKSAEEKEVNEYGVALVNGQYDLNKNGRQVSGTEITQSQYPYSAEKRTLDGASYRADGSGKKYWSQIESDGSVNLILETVDKNDKILSVTTTSYDPHHKEIGKKIENNSYNNDGNKTATIVTFTDAEGEITFTENTNYSYNNSQQLTQKTVQEKGSDGTVFSTVTSSYEYDQSGNLKTATENDGYRTKVTNYNYTDTGKKTSSTTTSTSGSMVTVTETKYDDNERASAETKVVKGENGSIFSTESTEYSYNAEHVVTESISTKEYPDGSSETVITSYDSNGRMANRSWITVDSEGKVSSTSSSWTYNADGNVTSSKSESTDPEGKTSSSSTQIVYDAQGRQLEQKVTSTYDGQTITSTTSRSYDAQGRIIKSIYESVNPDGTKTGSVTTTTYDAAGNYTEKTEPIGESSSGVMAAKLLAAGTDEEKTVVDDQNSDSTALTEKTENVSTGDSTDGADEEKAGTNTENEVPADSQIEETSDKKKDGSSDQVTNTAAEDEQQEEKRASANAQTEGTSNTEEVVNSAAEDEQQGEKNTSSDAQNNETKEVQDGGDGALKLFSAPANESQKAGTGTEDTIPDENGTDPEPSMRSTVSDTNVFSFKAKRGLNISSNLQNEATDPVTDPVTTDPVTDPVTTDSVQTSIKDCTCGDHPDPDEHGICRICHGLCKIR